MSHSREVESPDQSLRRDLAAIRTAAVEPYDAFGVSGWESL